MCGLETSGGSSGDDDFISTLDSGLRAGEWRWVGSDGDAASLDAPVGFTKSRGS